MNLTGCGYNLALKLVAVAKFREIDYITLRLLSHRCVKGNISQFF